MGSYKKNLLLTLGLLSLSVDLYPAVNKKNRTELKRVCPEHKSPVGISNVCRPRENDDHDEHEVSYGAWLLQGYDKDGNIRYVHEKNRPSFEVTEELKLTAVPAKELENATFEGQSIFYCKPSSDAETVLEAWNLFLRGVEQSKNALVTKGVLRKNNNEKLYRLTSFNGYLVLRELEFPDSINTPPEEVPAMRISKQNQDLFKQLIDMTVNDFESLNPENQYNKRVEAWLETGEKDTTDKPPKQNTADTLQQMIKDAMERSKK